MNHTQSENLYKRAQQHLVGGVNSPVRAFKSVGGNPLFISHGKGSKIYDVDENEYIDFVGSYGPLILGHAYETVVEKVNQAAEKSFSFGASSEGEIELAEIICEAIPDIEMVRFVNSGTEAVMSALRLAKGFTKKNLPAGQAGKIIKFAGCYHGHADSLLVQSGSGLVTLGLPGSAGVSGDSTKDTLVAIYNNIQSVEKLFEQFPEEIAGVIIEPVAGNMGVVVPENDFLKKIETLTKKYKALLIVDEVMTGFRSKFGAAYEFFDIKADIVCLGKVIGGGMPVGAYGARKEIMEMVAPLGSVYQAGTLSGNPIAMAAGIETLKQLKNINPYDQFNKHATHLKIEMKNIAESKGIALQVNQFGSMINPFFTDKKVTDFESAQTSDTKLFAKFFWEMTNQGIYLPPSQFESWFLSAVHTDEDIQKTVDVFKISIEAIA